MQLFINNWSTTLTSAVAAEADTLQVDPAAAELLVELGGDNFYRLTLVEVEESGLEVAWEVVRVSAESGGTLSLMETTLRDWPAGTLIEARLTAEAVEELQSDIEQVKSPAIRYVYDTTYTLEPADAGCHLLFVTDTLTTVTVAGQEIAGWSGNVETRLVQVGAGPVQVSDAGITLHKPASLNARTAEQYAVIALKRWEVDEWHLSGHLEPV